MNQASMRRLVRPFVAMGRKARRQAGSEALGHHHEIGFDPVDTGGLASGGLRQQPGSPIYNVALTASEAKKALAAAT